MHKCDICGQPADYEMDPDEWYCNKHGRVAMSFVTIRGEIQPGTIRIDGDKESRQKILGNRDPECLAQLANGVAVK